MSSKTENCCEICGIESSSKCGKCKSVYYCGADHQRKHWGTHKKVCGKSVTSTEISRPSISPTKSDDEIFQCQLCKEEPYDYYVQMLMHVCGPYEHGGMVCNVCLTQYPGTEKGLQQLTEHHNKTGHNNVFSCEETVLQNLTLSLM